MKQGLPLDRRIVLTAGHLIELKGHHRVVKAIRELGDEYDDVELLIVGAAPGGGVRSYAEAITQVIDHLGMTDRVRFPGEVPQMALAELMSAADVFCMASSREGWPNVVHEAMACGAPVVATNVGGVPEMIPSSRHGMVVPRGDPGALTAALREALSRPWDRALISEWGRSRSWDHVAAEVIARLREAAAQ